MRRRKSDESGSRSIRDRFYAVSYTRIIASGYLLLVLLGTFLLMLPVAAKSGEWTSFADALTTATSASCVTGLVVFDTFTHWSLFGQFVLLVLIQVGGLGYMTLITLFSLLIGRKIGLRERGLLKESTNALSLGGLISLTKKIVIGTVLFEIGGAVLLSVRFIPLFGPKRGIYYSVFHSVSAFCNAGFDLMGALEPYSSLTHFVNDAFVLLTLSFLIFIGGIGFIVWDDFVKHHFRLRKYRLHSKIVLATSMILNLGGAAALYMLEYRNQLSDMSVLDGIVNALFASVTTRTAGFNAISCEQLTPGSVILHLLYMLIGGSPGSTAGGMKTTTFAVLLLAAWANMRSYKHINVFGRRLGGDIVRKALTVSLIYGAFVFTSSILISFTNPALTLSQILFEVASAIGTVGLSCGTMGQVNLFGQMVLTLLMYCGRVGSMSFALIFTETKRPTAVMMPEEKIMIG